MKEKDTILKKLTHFSGRPGPLLLIIMDGVGIGKKDDSDMVHQAHTPHLDALKKQSLYAEIKAHGTAVGMPSDEDMGNSEVGHNALGAGRIFRQGASLVKQAVESKDLYQEKTWDNMMIHLKDHESTLHFIGLLSDGNVHSHINHLLDMLTQASKEKIKKCRVHILLDGRDVSERSALHYIDQLQAHLDTLHQEYADIDYRVASGGGRMITSMDRYGADWSVVERGWKAHVLGEARPFKTAREAVQTFYDEDLKIMDQYLPAFVIEDEKGPVGTIEDGDSVICFNFRGDRVIELTQAFERESFNKFDRVRWPKVFYAGMMQYDGDQKIPTQYLVAPPQIDKPLSYYLCELDIPSFAISETQKYGHVTYFWNGNKSDYIDENLEAYIEIPSDKIAFDEKPEMKAYEITQKTIELLESGQYKFGRVNFPNGDMVGHTGNLDATLKSIEVTDECVGKLVEVIKKLNGLAIILADHGNADEMFVEKDGKRKSKTAHSLNPVPFIIVDPEYQKEYILTDLKEPGLANVAATICNLLGYNKPEDYETSLVEFSN